MKKNKLVISLYICIFIFVHSVSCEADMIILNNILSKSTSKVIIYGLPINALTSYPYGAGEVVNSNGVYKIDIPMIIYFKVGAKERILSIISKAHTMESARKESLNINAGIVIEVYDDSKLVYNCFFNFGDSFIIKDITELLTSIIDLAR